MEKIRGFEICKGYENQGIELPVRQTKCSVGYDIKSAHDVVIPSLWKNVYELIKSQFSKSDEIKIKPTLIKTGVKSYFMDDEVLYLYNRSSNPFKKGLVLANSVGVIESDYYGNESNDGELMFAYYNFYPFDINIKKGDRIGQGVFQKFLISDDDRAEGVRKGGFGSTN